MRCHSLLLCTMLFSLLFCLDVGTPGPVVMAASVMAERATASSLPPLPLGCGHGGTPLNYDLPVCCVSGYVYVDSQPVAGALVTARANGHTHLPVETAIDADSQRPYFTLGLQDEPLSVKPGDLVTITASYGGLTKTVVFAANPGGQQVDVVMPKVDSTWLAAPSSGQTPLPPFTQWQGVGATYEQAGQYLLFGGLQGNPLLGSPRADTFHWQATQWAQLTPTTSPPARYGHQLAHNQTGDQVLLFGGVDTDGFYLNDTWLWQGSNWSQSHPATQPPARAYTSLTYDSQRNVWVLFGGLGNAGVLSDTWEFDGLHWHSMPTATQPAPRRLASLTYDPNQQHAMLFGGRTTTAYVNDLWAWDGHTWTQRSAALTPSPRAGHGATYDPEQKVVVIAGGFGPTGGLTDTWVWTGERWLARSANPPLPGAYALTMDFDPVNHQIAAFGERVGGNQAGDGIWLHKVITANLDYDATPIATIQYTNQRDARQGLDSFEFIGRGADGDATDQITGYRWSHAAITLSTNSTLTLLASALPLGAQAINFAVRDDEGNWSAPVTQTVFIRTNDTGATTTNPSTWALLLYVVGDNPLAPRLDDIPLFDGLLFRLRTAGAQAHVQVGVLYDGPGANDTRRYLLPENGQWQQDQTTLPEADMGRMETLRDFLRWGYATFQTDYVALALVGPANGVVGFGRDEHNATSNKATFLSPSALRTALEAATATGGRKLDVLAFDGSSFGLLEDASMVDGLTNFMVVSPDTSLGVYPYDQYRRLAVGATPRDFARAIAQQYAESAAVRGLPYIVSVFDLAQFNPLQRAVGQLGDQLLAYVQKDVSQRQDQIAQVRKSLYKYNSGGRTPNQTSVENVYVDLKELAATLAVSVTDASVQAAAGTVAQQVQNFVIYQRNALGVQQTAGGVIHSELTRLGGVGIFYPPDARAPSGSATAAYITNRLFPITRNWGWTNFITGGLPRLSICLPSECPPQLGDDQVVDPLPLEHIFLPFITHP